MQAWFARRYGGPEVLSLEEAPRAIPGTGEVLIRIHATTVNSGDVRVRGCDFPPGMRIMGRLALGWNGPRRPILGTELAGVVAAIGPGVTRFALGQRVFAFVGMRQGAHAEFATLAETAAIAAIPDNLDFAHAAALSFGGTTALHYLRKSHLQSGQSILVLGGSGAVGLAIIQLARHTGATVTATTSTGNLGLVSEFGAAAAIDYTTADLATLAQRFDVVADTVGATDFARAQSLLKPGGRYLAIAGALAEMLRSLGPGPNGTRMIAGPAAERPDDIATLARLAAAGHYRPHIDRTYPFADMPAAHAHVDTGRKRGSVVVELPDDARER